MPIEAQLGHPQAVLLIGEAPLAWRANLASAQTPARAVQTASDVYTAAAHLLKAAAGRTVPTEPGLPAAVLVWIESLRGDELRFFDLLVRRWPTLPVAAVYEGAGQDRKLDVCRRKGVAVVSSSAVQDWLSQHVAIASVAAPESAVAHAPAEPPARPVSQTQMPPVAPSAEPKPAAGDSIQDPDTQAGDLRQEAWQPDARAPEASQDTAAIGIHDLPDESFVDLPDELVAHLPDHLDEDLPEQAPDVEEPSEADLERELPEVEEDDEDGLPPPPLEETDDSDGEHKHLTPWSNVPRVERKRPVRKPPQAKQAPPDPSSDIENDVPAEGDGNGQQAIPLQQPGTPAINKGALPDYGLLTPEELRALLQDPEDGDDSQEARP